MTAFWGALLAYELFLLPEKYVMYLGYLILVVILILSGKELVHYLKKH